MLSPSSTSAVGVTNAKVSGLTIEDANSSSGGGITSGGGVFNGGTLNITDSTLSGEQRHHVRLYKYLRGRWRRHLQRGNLTITDSTLSGNTATTSGCTSICEADGGGIYNGGNLTITDSTLSGNTASLSGCTTFALPMAAVSSTVAPSPSPTRRCQGIAPPRQVARLIASPMAAASKPGWQPHRRCHHRG